VNKATQSMNAVHCEEPLLKSRRRFLSGLMLLGVSPVSLALSFKNKTPKEHFVSAQGSELNNYGLSWYDVNSKNLKTTLSGFRGHGAAQHPVRTSSIVMFGRRPATLAIEVDLLNGKVKNTFHCVDNRHFFGHGCFSQDGKTLFTTEADVLSGKGKVGIRDALTYQKIGEYESYGIGPHELKLLPDGKTLVIANGGIHTHPDTGRKKLNLDHMHSSLTYVDVVSGKKLDDFSVSEPKASIRHLDVAADGTVALAMQVQRVVAGHENTVPLGAIHKPGESIRLLDNPQSLIHQMDDYMGSVAVNSKHRLAGFTSPRGNLVVFWNIDSGELAGYHQLSDVCGLAVTSDQQNFVISSSFGQIRKISATTLIEDKAARIQLSDTRWDNHLLTVTL